MIDTTVVGLPFELPQTPEASDWLMELDFVDLHEGPIKEIELLAEQAPSVSARDYLLRWAQRRRAGERFEFMGAASHNSPALSA